MRRDPALTYRGALAILGKQDRVVLNRIDRALGGAILGSGPFAPGVLFGFVGQKNEGVKLVRDALDKIDEKLLGTSGHGRHELIEAAHSVLVVSAFFDGLESLLGDEAYKSLEIKDSEKLRLLLQGDQANAGPVLARLLSSEIPAPSAMYSFLDNLTQRISPYFMDSAIVVLRFMQGLSAFQRVATRLDDKRTAPEIERRATAKYRDQYVRFAAQVPEFAIWACLNESSALSFRQTQTFEILNAHSDALGAVRSLLEKFAPNADGSEARTTLAHLYSNFLREPLVKSEVTVIADEVAFPSVEKGYVAPHYRSVRFEKSSRVEQEEWWDGRPVQKNLENLLLAHLSAPESARLPLVVLGQPGAGKSLLTRVLAANLPESAFLTAWVPLRHVDADAPIHRQVQQALLEFTHERVSWSDLVEDEADSTRVVLLDGLDELMQLTGVVESGYLEDVAEFQQRELELHRPTVAIATSRTVVADRARIPVGSLVIRLEPFDDNQIESWLESWAASNQRKIESGKVRLLSKQGAVRAGDFARQPLLLMLLALYTANPSSPDPEGQLQSRGLLYGNLLGEFIRREMSKVRNLGAEERERRVMERMRHLGITAFAMFNRGRQYVTESELEGDLDALIGPELAAPQARFSGSVSRSHRMIGQFYFIHKAAIRRAAKDNSGERDEPLRSYEFLHATFGDYFMAAAVLAILDDVVSLRQATANMNFSDRGSLFHNSAQTMLMALLSQQPLAKSVPLESFLHELSQSSGLNSDPRPAVALDEAIRAARTLVAEHGYNPAGSDLVVRIGTYIANLITLRVVLYSQVSMAELSPSGWEPAAWWESTVRLLRASLDGEGWNGFTNTVEARDGSLLHKSSAVSLRGRRINPAEAAEIGEAQLISDGDSELRIRLGGAAMEAICAEGASRASSTAEAILALALRGKRASIGDVYEQLLLAVREESAEAVSNVLENSLSMVVSCIERDFGNGRLRPPSVAVEFVQLLPSLIRMSAGGTGFGLTLVALRREVDRREGGRPSLEELTEVPPYNDQ